MEEKLAIFTAGEYYLLPENFPSFEDFARFIVSKKSTKLKITKLSEVKCLAPYFTDRAKTECVVSFSAENPIFKTKVFLLSQEEYHDRLVEVIKKTCLDCSNFIDDGNYDELNGHYEEITIDGVCLKKREKGFNPYYVFGYSMADFINAFKASKTKIEELICKDNIFEAKNEILSVIVNFMPIPIDIVLQKKKKTYACYFPTFSDDVWGLIFYYLCKNLNGNIEGWEFFPYLPQGIIPLEKEYEPSIYEDSINLPVATKRVISFYLKEDDIPHFSNTYLYLCSDIGEDKFLRGTADCFVGYGQEKVGHEISYSDFKKAILKTKKAELKFDDESPVPVWTSVASFDENAVPNKLAYYCSNLFFNCFESVQKPFINNPEYKQILINLGIELARLNISVESAIYSKNIISKLLLALKNMLNNNFSVHFAREILSDRLNIYFMVFNKEKFLYELKRHSPIFETFAATLDIAGQNEVKKFEVNQHFKLILSEKIQ